MNNLYKDYFNIDPKYYSAVTEQLIKDGDVSWSGFYPHATFIKLLEATYNLLSKKDNRSIWVEGAYGTGKSHAALTIKSLLECPDQELVRYFEDFKLSQDLKDKFLSIKNSGTILTIHRIGTSSINNDIDLVVAIQQSIMEALKEKGIQNFGEASMAESFVHWTNDQANKDYFNALAQKSDYLNFIIGGKSVDEILQLLSSDNPEMQEAVMKEIVKVLYDAGQNRLIKTIPQLVEWIKNIIDKNQLEAIVFIWDEFTEYLKNHPVALTGFQTIVELSQSKSFYMMIITHESSGLFSDKETRNKILGRFQPPIKIELPETMAFKLMAQAMKKTSDPELSHEWEDFVVQLNNDLHDVINTIKHCKAYRDIENKDLQTIVPMHPYAALLLKNIATLFNSNQRSMFDFIISNDMTNAKGFKWYINQFGPFDDDYNFLTIDLLWDFFSRNEQNSLNDKVRSILSSYNLLDPNKLVIEEQRVLKTIALLQAISLELPEGQELLTPTEENIDLAFSGLPNWPKGRAIRVATGLLTKNFIFKRPISNNRFEFSILSVHNNESIEPYKKSVKEEIKTSDLIAKGELKNAIAVPDSCKERFLFESACFSNFNQMIQKVKSIPSVNRFKTVITFAIDDEELAKNNKVFSQHINELEDLIIIETLSPMGKDLLERYIDNMAHSKFNAQKDKKQAEYYQNEALKVLQTWVNQIKSGAFMLYTPENRQGLRIANAESLKDTLAGLNKKKYYYGLEQYTLSSTMYSYYNPGQGAESGLTQKVAGAYKASASLSIENALKGAWNVEKYWENPDLQQTTIVKVKQKVDEIIQKGFQSSQGSVSIGTIWEELEQEPFGFMPTAITALVLGFVLKEYAVPEYYWTNTINTEVMSVDKMKSMISNLISYKKDPSKHYRAEFIRSMTPEARAFLDCTSKVFNIPPAQCGSIEQARDQLRIKMRELTFPIWCLKSILDEKQLSTSHDILSQLIDAYMGLVNTANGNDKREEDYAEKIGQIILKHTSAVEDLSALITCDSCQEGMIAYIHSYKNGILAQLSQEINDNGDYLDIVKQKFNAGDANWVWNKSTADEKISDVILEYQIISESNKILEKSKNLTGVIAAWNAKTHNIKISCDAVAKHVVSELEPFLKQLYDMKLTNSLPDQNKQKFYNLLITQKENFDSFYKNQIHYFKLDAESFLSELSEEEIEEFYKNLPANQFTKTRSDYYASIENQINQFIQNQWKKKLQNLWFERTHTKSPKDWSNLYGIPILCLFDDDERANVKKIFEVVMSNNPNDLEAENAYNFILHADFFAKLNDETYRNNCFTKRILQQYAVLLSDIDKVKQELLKSSQEEVYNWFDNSSIQNQLKKMADKQYKLSGYDKAMNLIEQMSPEQLKSYMKEKISNDIDFGLLILKDRQG